MPNVDRYPIPNTSIASQQLHNEAVLVLPQHGQVKVLNEVGARVWALTDGTRTVGAIIDTICNEFNVDRPQAEADVLQFVSELERRDMLRLDAQSLPGVGV